MVNPSEEIVESIIDELSAKNLFANKAEGDNTLCQRPLRKLREYDKPYFRTFRVSCGI